MDTNTKAVTSLPASSSAGSNLAAVARPGSAKAFAWATIALVACFSVPLARLAYFAATSDLYSHILLVPFVSVYLASLNRRRVLDASMPAWRFVALTGGVGLALLAGYWLAMWRSWPIANQDGLAWTTSAFLFLLFGLCGVFADRDTLQAMRFPLCFLLFMIPFPLMIHNGLEGSLQRGSALTAYGLFQISGTPVYYDNMSFQLPGFGLAVAPECSGIHSSLVLFLTSLIAGYLFLRSSWRRTVLAVAVLPLGLLRNGFRIFVIGELCVHVGPQMIYSEIHRNGGPVFFALSMVPFLLLLFLLRRAEQRQADVAQPPPRA
ncbi:MAG TPA: exosortase/archaeosortase family protein [Verrucomicrobiae bacterium]|nr:exosortase/archaeosortase family protein [Verrucomicrobiae bacterium]